MDGLRKARFSGLQFIPHPLGEDGRGGLGGNRSRGLKEAVAVYCPWCLNGVPKGAKKRTKKKTQKGVAKGTPKTQKKDQGRIFGGLGGELKMELRPGLQKVRFWYYLVHFSQVGRLKKRPSLGSFLGQV